MEQPKTQLTNQEKEALVIEGLTNKKSKFFFYTPNTKGFPSAAVGYVYELVSALKEKGYEAFIFHEKEYQMPKWLGSNLANLPHVNSEQIGVISPIDFLFLPEAFIQSFFADLAQNNAKLPCEFVVLSQMYDLIFHTLDIGNHWGKYGISQVITTSNTQKTFIDEYMRGMNVQVVNPYIQSAFEKSDKPNKPFVFIFSRDKKEGEKVVNMFHQKYPQYAWIPFKFINNMDRVDFATNLKECCLSVWIDDISSFGTFPLESMACGVPVLGKIPDLMPEWMGTETNGQYNIKANGIWVLSKLAMPNYIARFLGEWLSDSLDPSIYAEMATTAAQYTKEKFVSQIATAIENILEHRITKVKEIFAKQALQPAVQQPQTQMQPKMTAQANANVQKTGQKTTSKFGKTNNLKKVK